MKELDDKDKCKEWDIYTMNNEIFIEVYFRMYKVQSMRKKERGEVIKGWIKH